MNVGISHLRAFVAVVDSGSFSMAADELRVTQSAVSHSVAALERSLGTPVLVRGGRARPTTFGEQILEHARTVVGAYTSICELSTLLGDQPSGTVRIAAPPTACQGILPSLLPRWRADLPRVQVVVLEGEDDEVEGWLRDDIVELAVLVDPGAVAGVHLRTDRFHALLRDDHPLAGEPEIDVRDLDDDPLIISHGGCEKYVHEVYRKARAPFRPCHHVRELGTLLTMVRSGIGISVVPELTEVLLDGQLAVVPLAQKVCRNLVLAGPVGRSWHPLATALVEWCQEQGIGSPGGSRVNGDGAQRLPDVQALSRAPSMVS